MIRFATHLKISIGCLLFGFVASSFWGGYSCTTAARSFGDRIQVGLVWVLLSSAKLGRLTTDPLRTKVYNVWPLALLIGSSTAALVYLLLAYKRKANAAPCA